MPAYRASMPPEVIRADLAPLPEYVLIGKPGATPIAVLSADEWAHSGIDGRAAWRDLMNKLAHAALELHADE